jgi:hypothetical protein
MDLRTGNDEVRDPEYTNSWDYLASGEMGTTVAGLARVQNSLP